MKKRLFPISLALVAALCLALGLWEGGEARTLLTFPFAPVAALLRKLSLSGVAGNILAWILFLLLTLWPLAWLVMRAKAKRLVPEDLLLPLLTGTLLTAFYQMINPGELLPMFGNMAALGRPLLAMAVWSTLCCYLTLRLLRGAANCQPRELARWIPGLVWVLAAVFVGRLFGQDLPAFVENWRSGNFFALITLMAAAVPTVFSIRTTCAAGRLLEALTCGRYSAQAVEAADRLADTCRTALAVTVVTQLFYNLMQVLGASVIGDVNVRLSLPVLELAFLLAVLLLSRLLARGQQLQQDNDLFI